MTKRCDLTSKTVLSGNNVSHSKRKTRRKFLPNLRNIKLKSDILGQDFPMKISMAALRSIEKNNGLDGFLLKTKNHNLDDEALKIKSKIKKKLLSEQKQA